LEKAVFKFSALDLMSEGNTNHLSLDNIELNEAKKELRIAQEDMSVLSGNPVVDAKKILAVIKANKKVTTIKQKMLSGMPQA